MLLRILFSPVAPADAFSKSNTWWVKKAPHLKFRITHLLWAWALLVLRCLAWGDGAGCRDGCKVSSSGGHLWHPRVGQSDIFWQPCLFQIMYYQQALMRSTVKSSVSLGGYVPNLLVLLRCEQWIGKKRTFALRQTWEVLDWLKIRMYFVGQEGSFGGWVIGGPLGASLQVSS